MEHLELEDDAELTACLDGAPDAIERRNEFERLASEEARIQEELAARRQAEEEQARQAEEKQALTWSYNKHAGPAANCDKPKWFEVLSEFYEHRTAVSVKEQVDACIQARQPLVPTFVFAQRKAQWSDAFGCSGQEAWPNKQEHWECLHLVGVIPMPDQDKPAPVRIVLLKGFPKTPPEVYVNLQASEFQLRLTLGNSCVDSATGRCTCMDDTNFGWRQGSKLVGLFPALCDVFTKTPPVYRPPPLKWCFIPNSGATATAGWSDKLYELYPHEHVNSIIRAVNEAIRRKQPIIPTVVYAESSSFLPPEHANLCHMVGVIPHKHGDKEYHAPIRMVLPIGFPLVEPVIYLNHRCSEDEMMITSAHPHIDNTNGRCVRWTASLPGGRWVANKNGGYSDECSNLCDVSPALEVIFSERAPLFAKRESQG